MSSNINATTPTFSIVSSYPFHNQKELFLIPIIRVKCGYRVFGNGMKMGSVLATGITDFSEKKSSLVIYPNPSNGLIKVQAENNSVVKIVNTLGEQVAEVSYRKELIQ